MHSLHNLPKSAGKEDENFAINNFTIKGVKAHINYEASDVMAANVNCLYFRSLIRHLISTGGSKEITRKCEVSLSQHYNRVKLFVHKSLYNCSHVFLRVDKVQLPLRPPYSDLYKLVKRLDNRFIIIIDGEGKTTSIDRLKPAFVAQLDLPLTTISQSQTDSKNKLSRTYVNKKKVISRPSHFCEGVIALAGKLQIAPKITGSDI
ncbi:PREDICTED: uncharacterized protein LOC108553930 [Eufriesea mexicana]|uniref:uncharacterized protein LOC108553930 n=1 Tax=Eufriesea mexicana TaxID=516756 RepID=UPI00083C31B3|nr:PREDICTED: uncharacterized protein LOC108553930 [Eufriesea mexicana]